MHRRHLITNAAIIGCSAAASPLGTPMLFANARTENRLVVILLRGAMDGLDVVQPYGDKNIGSLRKGHEFGPKHGDMALTSYFSMNSGLRLLAPLWSAGDLAFAHAVSTPYRDKRSHFDGQDLLEAGTGPRLPLPNNQSGWLNRLIASFPKITSETAYVVGAENQIILRGSAPHMTWDPKAEMPIQGTSLELLKSACGRDKLFLHAINEASLIYKELAGSVNSQGEDSAEVMDAKLVANRLRGQSRIACFSLGGWDTHVNQEYQLKTSLEKLSGAIMAIKKELGSIWERTTIMAMTEFGRTARINGSKGTDHGTGGAMIMAGGNINGKKVYGTWPGLVNLYQDRDLMPTEDVRRYPGWAMHHLYGIPTKTIETVIFPGLRLGNDPKIIAR